MKVLLDTHALIWAVASPDRLGEAARDALTTEGVEAFASHVSLWEMAIKRRIGKLDELGRSATDWFEMYVARSRLKQLPIKAAHVGAVEFLPLLHGDPFDRLIVAQARVDGFTVITRDELITQYDVDVIW
jgi:PIN domain nuclease of toxin-antitoxin system